jgi:hypothetical protein
MILPVRITVGAILLFLIVILTIETVRVTVCEIAIVSESLKDTELESVTIKNVTSAATTDSCSNPRLQNLRLVFLGDSVTRYQYLSLVYFLRYGRWYDIDMSSSVNNLMNAHSFHHPFHPNEDWNEFFLQSNRMLHPMEICDCIRSGSDHAHDILIERRYFYDATYNNMIVYINMNGNETHPGRGYYGRLSPDRIFGPDFHKMVGVLPGMNQQHPQQMNTSSAIEWEFTTWGELIRQYIGRLDLNYNTTHSVTENQPPRNAHVLLNAGLHPHDFHDINVAQDVKDALNDIQLPGTWKTTTYTKDFVLQQQSRKLSSKQKLGAPSRTYLDSSDSSDRQMCTALHQCLNVSWIAQLQTPSRYYFDNLHFLEPIYRIFNEEFLDLIGQLPVGYQRYNRSNVLMIRSDEQS